EQYLIRAEARVYQNNLSGAIDDLNVVRQRAGLPLLANSLDQHKVLSAILHERQVELFSEWGHRWFDLKRTGSIDSVMSAMTPIKSKGGVWKSYQQLYPLPWNDVLGDPNLVQNPGYHQ